MNSSNKCFIIVVGMPTRVDHLDDAACVAMIVTDDADQAALRFNRIERVAE